MEKNLRNCSIKNLILVSFLLILFYIIIKGIFLYTPVIYEYNSVILLLGIVAYITAITLFYKYIVPKIDRDIVVYIMFFCFTSLAIFTAIKFMLSNEHAWDMPWVFNIAKNYVETGICNDLYLAAHPNNIGITLLFAGVFKVIGFFGLSNYLVSITVFNAIVVSSTVVIMYYIAKEILDRKKAMLLLIIALMTTPLYLHSAIYYTDTLSMFICTSIFFIYLKLGSNENKWLHIFYQIIFAVLIFLAINIKITAVFIVIAISIYGILNLKTREKHVFISKVIAVSLCTIVIVFVLQLLLNNYIRRYVVTKEDEQMYRFPNSHYFMMGLSGNGNFSGELTGITTDAGDYEEKKKVISEKIREMLSNYNARTFVLHIAEKIDFAWHDGTYWAPEKLKRSPVNEGIHHEFVLETGKYKDYYKYFPQIMHFSMLIFIFINTIYILKNKNFKTKEIICLIDIYGLLVFLLLWENRSRYLLVSLPMLMILSINGIDTLSKLKIKGKNYK